jgi:two-component system response regulator YesN
MIPIKAKLKSMFSKTDINNQIIKKDKENLICILQAEQVKQVGLQKFVDQCHDFTSDFKQNYSCDLFFYIGNGTTASGLAEMVGRLYDMEKDNVTLRTDVLLLDSKPKQFSRLNLPYMTVWSSLLAEKEYGAFTKEVSDYFDTLVNNGEIDSSILQQFHRDFLQMVYSLLKQKKIRHICF